MILRSPYKPDPNWTSWLGGLPFAPPDFEWPRDPQGRGLIFAGQIDLADIRSREGIARPAGLPLSGAMLHFIGEGPRCILVSEQDMQRAAEITIPETICDFASMDIFCDGPTLPRRPVDLLPMLEVKETTFPPNGVPLLPDSPGFDLPFQSWATNHGAARAEVDLALSTIEPASLNASKLEYGPS